jgi:hypothetical protein
MGSYPVTESLRQAYTGVEVLNLGADIFNDPLGVNSRGFYAGAIDGSTLYGDIIAAGPVADFTTTPTVHEADPNRRSLTRKAWMREFFITSSNPVGHGFDQTNLDNDFASSCFEPKADMPIKVITLDGTQRDEDFDIHGHGYLNKERFDWLVRELDKGSGRRETHDNCCSYTDWPYRFSSNHQLFCIQDGVAYQTQ